MGVIDLDARVKKLEQDAGGGAVIDQIEAELTALEEQINGDGETDLGLAGDVEALTTKLIAVDVTSELTDKANCVTDAHMFKLADNVFTLSVKVDNTLSSSDWAMLCKFPAAYGIPANVQVAANIAYGNAANVGKGGSAFVEGDHISVRIPSNMTESNHYAVISATWVNLPSSTT